MTGHQRRIYIAGPAVFNPDFGETYYNHARETLSAKGVKALCPVDNVVKGALEIRNKNIDMIKECDAVIADLSPFRGHEPDAGTCFEVGYAAALGKCLLVFTSDPRSMVEKYGGAKDRDGLTVEDFNLPFNLMLTDGEPVYASFDEAFGRFCQKFGL